MNLKKITKQELIDILDEYQRTIDRLTEDKRYYESESVRHQKKVYELDHKLKEKDDHLKRIEFEHRLNLVSELKAMGSFLSVCDSGATHRQKALLTSNIKEQFEKKAEELTRQLFSSNYYDGLPF